MRILIFVYIIEEVAHLISPQCDITRRKSQTNEGSHICLHYREGCSRTWAKCTSSVVLVNTRARSCAEAVEQDLRVAYPMIDVCVRM